MNKVFYLFRHGQTDMNLARRWQGRLIDAPLNPTGIRQAEALAAAVKPLRIQAVFSSPLLRAVQTAKIVTAATGAALFIDNGLIEGCFGEAEGKTLQEIHALFPDLAARWENLDADTLDTRFPNGESKREIQTRILRALTGIAETQPFERIGISCHSAAIRCTLLAFGQQYPQVPHGVPFRLDWDGTKFLWKGMP